MINSKLTLRSQTSVLTRKALGAEREPRVARGSPLSRDTRRGERIFSSSPGRPQGHGTALEFCGTKPSSLCVCVCGRVLSFQMIACFLLWSIAFSKVLFKSQLSSMPH